MIPIMASEQETEARKALAALDVKRKALEMEADAIHAELTSKGPEGQPPMGIDTPLVDDDGYPRADIDCYRARTLRGRFNEIQTDHKNIMKDIEKGLAKVAALSKTNDDKAEEEARKAKKPLPKFDAKTGKWVVKNWDGSVAGVDNGDQRSFETLEETTPTATTETSRSSAAQAQSADSSPTEPFAVIDAVASNSPAQQAGLVVGDQIVEFGSINDTNNKNLLALGELVPEAAGNNEAVKITVLRQTDPMDDRIREFEELTLRPRPWEGRGLLGCHIVKYTGPSS